MKKWCNIAFLVFVSSTSGAQDSLTLQQAVSLALKNNLGIQVTRNEKEIAELNSHAGNAGMLPIVTLNANGTTGSTNSYQEFANGTTQERDNARTTGINAGVNATWVIFDGMRMFATREKLREMEAMGELQLKKVIENTIEQVSTAYFNAERLKEQHTIYKNSIILYQERESLAKLRLESGSGNRAEYLQATVERTTQENRLMQTELEWKNALAVLRTTMSKTSDTLYYTSDSLTVPAYAATMAADISNNTDLQLAQKGIGIAQLEEKEIKSGYMPRISVGGNYNFINNNSQAGFVLLNRNYGYSGLINVSWTLFNANTTRTNAKIARLNTENQELLKKEAELILKEVYQRTYNQYALALQQVQSEQSNLLLASENLSISMDRYREGKSSLMEVREAQKYADDIRIRLTDALYNAQVSEIILKRVTGNLITQ